MRIAFFTRGLPAHGLGGMEIHSDQVARGLAARGHAVVVYTTRLPDGAATSDSADSLDDEPFPGHGPDLVGSPAVRTPPSKPGGDPRIRFLPRTRPLRYLGGYWKESARAFLRDHSRAPFDVAYSESAGAFGIMRPKRNPILPVLVFLVGTARGELLSKLRQPPTPRRIAGIVWNLISEVLTARRLPLASRILCESEGLRAQVLREIPALDPSRVSAAWLGVDTSLFTPDGPVHPAFETIPFPRVLLGGRLEREKAFDIGIRAVAALEKGGVHLVLAGEGREKSRLVALGSSLLGARFHWLPPVPHDELPGILRGTTLYLMPTIREEGSALSIVEAMACGLPVIASRVGGFATVVHDEEDGLLVPPGDPRALSVAVARLLADEPLRRRIAQAGRRAAADRFSLEAMLSKIEDALAAAVLERAASTRV